MIVDFEYYYNVYLGQEANQASFPALCSRAQDVICAMTKWKASEETVNAMPPMQRTLVKKAICAQVDFFSVNGLDTINSNVGNGFTVGKVHVNGKSVVGQKKGSMADYISPMAIMYLEQSGLMNPQVATGPDMPLIGGWL